MKVWYGSVFLVTEGFGPVIRPPVRIRRLTGLVLIPAVAVRYDSGLLDDPFWGDDSQAY